MCDLYIKYVYDGLYFVGTFPSSDDALDCYSSEISEFFDFATGEPGEPVIVYL